MHYQNLEECPAFIGSYDKPLLPLVITEDNQDCGVQQRINEADTSSDTYASPNIGSLQFQTASLTRQDANVESTVIKLQLPCMEMNHRDVMACHDRSFTVHPQSTAVKSAAAEKRSKQESTRIKLYRYHMQNETCRMMTSIDQVVSEAEQLFGLERTQIFFDLLNYNLFHSESAGAISDFVPKMAESAVRQHVISVFEYACDIMNRVMTLLLSCPGSKRLQQMPQQNFISFMQSVIDTSLKSQTKGGKGLSSNGTKGTRLIMVDSQDFEKARNAEIPEDVLERLRCGDEMIVHRFFGTRQERPQAPERRENRPISSIYFPSDSDLFIYIPTENGSYWHQSDMQRASRISQHYK